MDCARPFDRKRQESLHTHRSSPVPPYATIFLISCARRIPSFLAAVCRPSCRSAGVTNSSDWCSRSLLYLHENARRSPFDREKGLHVGSGHRERGLRESQDGKAVETLWAVSPLL